MLAYKHGSDVRLVSRNGRDHTKRFPDLADEIRRLDASALILDGEVAVFDSKLLSRFEWLRQRPPAEASTPPLFVAFDCLVTDNKDPVFIFGGAAIRRRVRRGRPRIFLSVTATRSGVSHLVRSRQGGMGMLKPARHGACPASAAWRPNRRSASSPGRLPKSGAGSCGYGPGHEWYYFPTSTWRN
jgi:hypothetical protein